MSACDVPGQCRSHSRSCVQMQTLTTFSHTQKCINIASPVTELTTRWLLSSLDPVNHGDLRNKRKKRSDRCQKRREAKIERTLTLLNRDVPSEDVLTISSSQNHTQTVGKERTLLFSCLYDTTHFQNICFSSTHLNGVSLITV